MQIGYDFRGMGVMRLIPFIALGLMTVLCFHSRADALIILKAYELFLPAFVVFWIVPLFFNYINPGTQEMFLSYSCSRSRQGIFRVLAFSSFYIVCMWVAYFLTISEWRAYWIYLFLFALQIIFYAAFSFWLVVTIKNEIVSFGVIWSYAGIQILDVSHTFSMIGNCFYDLFESGMRYVLVKAVLFILISGLLLADAQKRFRQMEAV